VVGAIELTLVGAIVLTLVGAIELTPVELTLVGAIELTCRSRGSRFQRTVAQLVVEASDVGIVAIVVEKGT
jgi:hypothetical protein